MEDRNAVKRTITGKNYEECRQKLYDLYGNNYDILNRGQVFKGGIFGGLFQKALYEVTYVVKDRRLDAAAYEQADDRVPSATDDLFERNRAAILKTTADPVMITKQVASLDSKLDTIKNELSEQLKTIVVRQPQGKHQTIQKIEEILSENEFSFSYITMITDRIKSEFSLEALDDFKTVQRKVVDWIGGSIQIAPVKMFRPPHVVVVIGPTGVGKTTTIAKLAAKQVLEAKAAHKTLPELSIITIDSMRVGAVEQISRFGSLLNTVVQKAESSDDVRKLYEDNKERVDAIYIDTGGYSPNDSVHIGEMKAILDVPNLNPDVYLAVSASTKASDLQKIMQNYEPFGYQSVIVTKCDETEKYGNIISTLYEKRKQLSYICDGQHVPRNIQRADVVSFLIRLTGFEIDRVHIEELFGEK